MPVIIDRLAPSRWIPESIKWCLEHSKSIPNFPTPLSFSEIRIIIVSVYVSYFLFLPTSIVTLFGLVLGSGNPILVLCITWAPLMTGLAHGRHWQESEKWEERPGILLPCPSGAFLAVFCLLISMGVRQQECCKASCKGASLTLSSLSCLFSSRGADSLLLFLVSGCSWFLICSLISVPYF